MTSLHRLIAIVVIWSAFAFVCAVLLGNAFLMHLSALEIGAISSILGLIALAATFLVLRSHM